MNASRYAIEFFLRPKRGPGRPPAHPKVAKVTTAPSADAVVAVKEKTPDVVEEKPTRSTTVKTTVTLPVPAVKKEVTVESAPKSPVVFDDEWVAIRKEVAPDAVPMYEKYLFAHRWPTANATFFHEGFLANELSFNHSNQFLLLWKGNFLTLFSCWFLISINHSFVQFLISNK